MQKQFTSRFHLVDKVWIITILSLLILLNLTNTFAQETQTPKQYQPPQTSSEPVQGNTTLIISPDEDYLIGPSDVIDIKIEDAPELSGTFRLNAKGTLTLPVIGLLTLEKKTTEEVAKAITDKLRGDYLVNPIVSIKVVQSNSRAFFVQGAVRRPGIYQIEGRPSLLKLITIAGGLTDNYGSTAFVMREKKESENTTIEKGEIDSTDKEDYQLIEANINNLLRGNLEQNVLIEPGDIVHIPPTDVFFVSGEVKAPGAFPLKEGTTLRQAISLAQGTTYEGAARRGIIFRENKSGERQEIPIDIEAVMAGKKDDLAILPNDIIIVPNSRKKSIAKNLLQSFSSSLPGILLRGFGVY